MKKKIIGVTVGTPIKPSKLLDKTDAVRTVNGIAPDEHGNVEITGSGGNVDLTEQVERAETAANNAQTSENNAATSASKAEEYMNTARSASEAASDEAEAAATGAAIALEHRNNALVYANRAEEAANNAETIANGLPATIETALTEAKQSGEFDGHTPVKGVDYYTEAEQTEIDARIVEEVAKYVGGGTGEVEDISVSNDWSEWTVHETTNVNSTPALVTNATNYADYTTYSYTVDRDVNLYFENYSNADYLAIGIFPNGITADGTDRYRLSDNNLPTVDSPLTVAAGTAIAVTVKTHKFTLWGLAQSSVEEGADFTGTIDSIVTTKINSLQNGRIAVKFAKTSTYQRITVYHAANGDYCIGQIFERVPNTDKNSDVWHLKYAYLCNSKTLEQVNASPNVSNYFEGQIVNNGEWENAIKETGQDDFMGGTLHGDEIMTAVHFFLDGKPLDMTAAFLLYGDELKVIGTTELFRVNDKTVKVADRSCVWTFKNGEIVVNQTHKFAVDTTLDASYTMMLPVNKLYSETFLVDGNPSLLSFPKESANSYKPDFTKGVKEQLVNTFGNGVVCEFLVSCNQPGTWLMQDNGNEYNKMYFNIGNRNYSAGDIITTKSVFRMRVGM